MNLLLFFISLLTSVMGFNFYPENNSKFDQLQPADEVDLIQAYWDSVTINKYDPPVLYASTLNVTMTGKIMISRGPNEVPIYSFLRLKFAEKPKRFQPPVALKPPYYDDETFQANTQPIMCSQNTLLSLFSTSEDCLYLNVYTPPQMPDKDGNFDERYPVMIFFHGGSFMTGGSRYYVPTKLLDQKVIVVVPNYRLGLFGFFSTMDEKAPGNIGLYDQQMAMKWVQEHIESFGGDKSKVTIFGESAGSASVIYHLIIPSSQVLMHRVIGESGSALDRWALDEDPLDSAFAIAKFLKCDDTSNIDVVYNCLIELSADALAVGIFEFSEKDRSEGRLGIRGAAPIIQNPDMDLSAWDTEVLITKPPVDYFKDETFNSDVDLMIGANKHEGSFMFAVMYIAYFANFNGTENEKKMIPAMLQSLGIDDPTHSLSESLAKRYLAGANRSDLESSIPGLIDLAGVLFIKAGAMETAKLHSSNKKQNVNTYLYAFEYESESSLFRYLVEINKLPDYYLIGVSHGDELLYLFDLPFYQSIKEHQYPIRDALVKLWTNFATYGNPTPDQEKGWSQIDVTIEQWPNFDIDNEYYILIEEDSLHIEQRYSQRWTIANDEAQKNSTEEENTTEPYIILDQANKLKTEGNAYLAGMIIFIILFVIGALCCGYLLYKNRNKKTRVQIERKEIDKTKAAKIEQKEVDKKHKSKIEGKEMDGTTTINIQ